MKKNLPIVPKLLIFSLFVYALFGLTQTVVTGKLEFKRYFNLLSAKTQRLSLLKSSNDDPSPQPQDKRNKVLGDSAGMLHINSGQYGYNNGGVLAMSSTQEPKIYLSSFDVTGQVELKIYNISKQDLLTYLIHDGDGKRVSDPNFIDQDPEASLTADIVDDNEPVEVSLPIANEGLWFVTADVNQTHAETIILRSHLGGVVKEGDNQFIFWGQNFETGKSVSQADVKVYSLEQKATIIDQTNLDQQGLATTTLKPEADIALLEKDDDFTLIPISLSHISSKTSYLYRRFQKKQLSARYFTFTDKPLYQPGDTVRFKSVIRNEDDAQYFVPEGSVRVLVGRDLYDNEGVILDKNISLTEFGSVNGEVDLPEEIEPGYYQIKLILGPDEESYSSFRVQPYRKPEYTVDVEADKDEYVSGELINLDINGQFFSGEPLPQGEVEYSVYRYDYYDYTYLTDKSRLLQNDYLYWGYGKKNQVDQGTVALDSSGHAKLQVETKLDQVYQNQVFGIEIRYLDQSGNPVKDRKNVLVYAGDYGIYRDQYGLSNFRVNQEVDLPLVLHPHQGGNVNKVKLNVDVIKIDWIKEENPEHKYDRYKKVEKQVDELSLRSDREGKLNLKFTPNEYGSYKLVVTGEDARGNTIKKEFRVYVRKEGAPVYYNQQKKQLSLKTDQERYLPGDQAELYFYSEIPDRDVLITFERARVHRYQVVSLSGNSGSTTVNIKDYDKPNIYVNASSFSPTNLDTDYVDLNVSAEHKRLQVKIETEKDRYSPGETLRAKVTTLDNANQPVPAEVAFWAVDKAMFELAPDNLGDIFDTYWSHRYNATQEMHSLRGIVGRAAERGGGCFTAGTEIKLADGSTKPIEKIKDGDQILTRQSDNRSKLVKAEVTDTHQVEVSGYFVINQQLKVTGEHRVFANGYFKRVDHLQSGDKLLNAQGEEVEVESVEWVQDQAKVYNFSVANQQTYFANGYYVHNQKGAARSVFKDVAYWNPVVRTGYNGQTDVSFKLPDNLTTWVLSTVGATRDTIVGQETKEVQVAKKVQVRPVLPNLIRQGDKIKLSALIHNFTEDDHRFDVSLKFDQVQLETEAKQKIKVKAGEVEQVSWWVKADQIAEDASLIMRAEAADSEGLADAIETNLPIKEFGYFKETAQTGINETEYQLELNPNISADKSEVELSLDSTLIDSIEPGMKYLVGYPYGCTEQITSRLVALLLAKQNQNIFREITKDKDIEAMIKKGLKELEESQHSDGGWPWWFESDSSAFVTAHVVEALLEAQSLGYDVENQLRKVRSFVSAQRDDQHAQIQTKVSKAYIRALLGLEDQTGFLAQIPTTLEPDLLSMAIIAKAKRGQSDHQALQTLLNQSQEQSGGVFWQASDIDRFGSKEASTAMAMRALLAAGGSRDLAAQGAKYLLRARKTNYWRNTYGTVQVTRALTQLVKSGYELNPNYSYQVDLDDQTLRQDQVQGNNPINDLDIDLGQIKDSGSVLNVNRQGQGQLYSTLRVKQFITSKQGGVESNGVSLERGYVNQDGSSQLKVGDEVTVKLTVSGLSGGGNYGVIRDYLPAGLIPVNKVLKNEQKQGDDYNYRVHQETRDDGMVLSLWRVDQGKHVYTYQARVINAGEFTAPPARFKLMYAPEFNALSDVKQVKIGKAPKGKFSLDQLPTDQDGTINWLKLGLQVFVILVGVGVIGYLIRKVVLQLRSKRNQNYQPKQSQSGYSQQSGGSRDDQDIEWPDQKK